MASFATDEGFLPKTFRFFLPRIGTWAFFKKKKKTEIRHHVCYNDVNFQVGALNAMLKNYSMNVLYIRVISLDVSAENIFPRPAISTFSKWSSCHTVFIRKPWDNIIRIWIKTIEINITTNDEFNIYITFVTSIHVSFEVISVRVGSEVFGSRFFGTVVQFTSALGNDVIKTLASRVAITFSQAHITKWCSCDLLVDVSS